jgi:hypothetical protein
MKLHEIEQTTHFAMSKSKPKTKAVPKKKEIERTLVTFSNQKKEMNPTKKIKPPTYLAMSKSRSKSKAVSKKKEMKTREKNCLTMSKVQVEVQSRS